MAEFTDAQVKQTIIAQALERLKSANADLLAATRMVEFAATESENADNPLPSEPSVCSQFQQSR